MQSQHQPSNQQSNNNPFTSKFFESNTITQNNETDLAFPLPEISKVTELESFFKNHPEFKAGLTHIIDRLYAWLDKKGSNKLEEVAKKIEKFKNEYITYEGTNIERNTTLIYFYRYGTPLLYQILKLIEDESSIPLNTSTTRVENLFLDFAVCGPGAYEHVQDTYFDLCAVNSDVPTLFKSIRTKFAKNILQQFIQDLRNKPNQEVRFELQEQGLIIHYIIATIKSYADVYGLSNVENEDPYAANLIPGKLEFLKEQFVKLWDQNFLKYFLDQIQYKNLDNLTNPTNSKDLIKYLNQFGDDDGFNVNRLYDQDALADDRFELVYYAKDLLLFSIIKRLQNSGYFNCSEIKGIVAKRPFIRSKNQIGYFYEAETRTPFYIFAYEALFYKPELYDNETRGQIKSFLLHYTQQKIKEEFLAGFCQMTCKLKPTLSDQDAKRLVDLILELKGESWRTLLHSMPNACIPHYLRNNNEVLNALIRDVSFLIQLSPEKRKVILDEMYALAAKFKNTVLIETLVGSIEAKNYVSSAAITFTQKIISTLIAKLGTDWFVAQLKMHFNQLSQTAYSAFGSLLLATQSLNDSCYLAMINYAMCELKLFNFNSIKGIITIIETNTIADGTAKQATIQRFLTNMGVKRFFDSGKTVIQCIELMSLAIKAGAQFTSLALQEMGNKQFKDRQTTCLERLKNAFPAQPILQMQILSIIIKNCPNPINQNFIEEIFKSLSVTANTLPQLIASIGGNFADYIEDVGRFISRIPENRSFITCALMPLLLNKMNSRDLLFALHALNMSDLIKTLDNVTPSSLIIRIDTQETLDLFVDQFIDNIVNGKVPPEQFTKLGSHFANNPHLQIHHLILILSKLNKSLNTSYSKQFLESFTLENAAKLLNAEEFHAQDHYRTTIINICRLNEEEARALNPVVPAALDLYQLPFLSLFPLTSPPPSNLKPNEHDDRHEDMDAKKRKRTTEDEKVSTASASFFNSKDEVEEEIDEFDQQARKHYKSEHGEQNKSQNEDKFPGLD